MKQNFTSDLKELATQAMRWLSLEVRYVKLTVTERATILMGTIALAFISLLIGMVILILLSFSLADWLREYMSPALSCLCVSGVLLLIVALIIALRRPLLMDPIARFLSRLINDKD